MTRVRNRFLTFTRVSRAGLMATAIASASLLSGCGSDNATTSFPPYQYDYLSKLQFNVATVQVLDHAIAGSVPGDESGQAPIPPDQALVQVAQDRLVAAGQTGSAIFTVDHASILHQPGGTLTGQMDAHLDINSATGQQLGVAEAHVTRNFKPDLNKGDSDSRANLYDMTRQMMQDMNVEMEFQIRKNLKDWLVDAGGTPVAGAIQTQTLTGSGTHTTDTTGDTAPATTDAAPVSSGTALATPETTGQATGTAASSAGTASAPAAASTEPDAIFPSGSSSDSSETTTEQKRTPAAGYLHLPSPTTQSTSTSSTGY
ncbi:hypothetical protein [Acetobacter oeni]|nr:hypothetical protein [Acetobacter oeni]MBB3883506.1 hypothetical protein [Acetobacter oeni]